METVIFKSKSKKAMKLLVELGKEIGVTAKKISAEDFEDFFLGKSIQKGLKSSTVSKEKVIKALKK
jgi:hypothetical protein